MLTQLAMMLGLLFYKQTFTTNLEGTGEGSIQDLINKQDSQESSISNLETSASALQTRINTLNAALEDGSDGVISTHRKN
jgi:chaperonin cofactor prefoldin